MSANVSRLRLRFHRTFVVQASLSSRTQSGVGLVEGPSWSGTRDRTRLPFNTRSEHPLRRRRPELEDVVQQINSVYAARPARGSRGSTPAMKLVDDIRAAESEDVIKEHGRWRST